MMCGVGAAGGRGGEQQRAWDFYSCKGGSAGPSMRKPGACAFMAYLLTAGPPPLQDDDKDDVMGGAAKELEQRRHGQVGAAGACTGRRSGIQSSFASWSPQRGPR